MTQHVMQHPGATAGLDHAPARYPVRLWNGDVADCHLHLYQHGSFTTQEFVHADISCPPEIMRSVRVRQAEFFHGRLAARRALAGHGIGGVQVGIGSGREPLWPTGIVGAITHTRRLAAAIALPARLHRGIGIDLEPVVGAADCGPLEDFVLDSAERALLRHCADGLSWPELVTIAFSAKESFYKAVYQAVRKILDFDAVTISAFDVQQGRLTFTVATPLSEGLTQGVVLHAYFQTVAQDTVLTSCSW